MVSKAFDIASLFEGSLAYLDKRCRSSNGRAQNSLDSANFLARLPEIGVSPDFKCLNLATFSCNHELCKFRMT